MNISISMRISLLALAIAAIFFQGCSKDDGENADATAALIGSGKPWRFSKATANNIDVTGIIDACIKDNLTTMMVGTSSNTGVMNEGASRCNASDPQQIDFTWTYDANFRKLTILTTGATIPIIPGASNEFTLVSISAAQMVLAQTVTFAGTTQNVQVTLIQ